jgi:TonB-linked SusC/RagA family outer membrane protein
MEQKVSNFSKAILLSIALFLTGGGLSVYADTQQDTKITVSGIVSDQDGPIIGALVSEKGSPGNGAATDENGKYSLQVPSNATLRFSALGYEAQEIAVGGRRSLDVSLLTNDQVLGEVVVIGYGSLEKKLLTNSVSSVTAKELPPGVGGATVANSIKGKVSSLTIQETASPNSETTLQMRGMASVNTSKAPLVVIDGMPGGDIRSVAPEDVQSIDFLKDASAGAIYGTRATGGVILITTKQAQEGKMRLSYTGEVLFKNNFGKPRVLTADEFRQYKPTANDYGANVDWWDEGMADNPTSQRHTVTMQGGTQNARIYASFMYDDNRGVLLGDTRKDLGGRINGNFKLVDGWLDVNTHIDYRQANRNESKPDIGSLINNNPTHDPNDPTKWNALAGGLGEVNTVQDAKLITNQGIDTWFRPDVEAILNILPVRGLSFHQTFGYEHRQWEWQNYQPSTSTLTEGNNRTGKGTAELKFDKTDLFNADGYFSYVNSFGEDHYLNVSAGYSYFERNGEMYRLKNYGFAVDAVKAWDMGAGTSLNNAAASIKAEMESKKQISQKLMAYFGRAHYAYKDKYIVSATVRREGSSKFATANRWGTFWQSSAAWRLSQEDFMQNITWLSELKPRVAYGVTGNEGFDADYAAVMYSPSDQVLLPSGEWVKSYQVNKNVNPLLGWEEKHEWNIGLDYSLFDKRIYGKLDFYSRNVEGLIYEVSVPSPPYTQGTMFKNIGTLENTGWEFEIGADVVKSGTWNYSTKLVLSSNSTKIGSMWGDATYYEKAGVGRAGNVHRIQENTKVGSFFLYKYAGLDSEGRMQAIGRDGNIITPEVDGKFAEDKQYIGNYLPTVTAGWSHNVSYKNWELGVTLTSWIDFDIYNEFEHTQATVNGTASGARNLLLDAFTKNKDIKGQPIESDFFLHDGTFLKIQNLTLGYNLDTKKYLKVVDSARLYFTANNLATFTKYKGLNPEVDITSWEQGVEWASIYPQTRTYTLGIQLNF